MRKYYTILIQHGIKKRYWTKDNYPKKIKLNQGKGIEDKLESKIPGYSDGTHDYRDER